ncbi:MAG: hypothetical protein U0324_23115 [Polyangiales bacterium]
MRRAALGWCGWAALGAAGCAAPNLYTSARTLPRGQTQWSVFTETSSTGTAHYPTLDVMFRVGLGARTELGLRGGGGPIGVDLKVGLLRGGLDLALVPAVHVSPFIVRGPQSVVVASYLPLLAGINLSRRVTLLAHVAPFYARRLGVPVGSLPCEDCLPEGAGLALGLGVRVLVAERVALHPAVAVMRSFVWPSTAALAGAERGWLSFGLAVSFVGQPDTSDLP